MKKIILILSIGLIAIANLQAQDTMYVHQKVGGIVKHAINNVDSVTFYNPTVTGVINQPTVTDTDGNMYNIVTIGGQVWTRENLKVKKFNDGRPISSIINSLDWAYLTLPGYCLYNNSTSTGSTFGVFYN
jgi:hypothetical protein